MSKESTLDMFSKFIKEKRISAGLSQKQVAQKLGYTTPQFVSNWERAKSHPPAESFRILSSLYKVSFELIVEMFLNSQKLMIYEKNGLRKKKNRSK